MEQVKSIFGNVLRDDYYLLDKRLNFTNHGSYGSIPKPIYEARQRLQLEFESAPDPWFRYKTPKLWYENRKALADFLQVDVSNLVLTENATDGTNAVLKSIDFNGSNDAILTNRYTYQAVKNAVQNTAQYRFSVGNHVRVSETPLKYPLKSVQNILDDFDNSCRDIIEVQKLKLRLVIIDHISSANAMIYPLKQLIEIVRKWDRQTGSHTFVLIDGAHAIGQIEINLLELDCDFYVSNLHKWFFAPRGCSFLYFKDQQQSLKLKPNVASHFYFSDASVCFFERGTRDSTSFYVVKDCIAFHVDLLGGYKSIRQYCTSLLENAVKLLTESWNTEVNQMPEELQAPFMRNVRLPKMCDDKLFENDRVLFEESLKLIRRLYENYNLVAVVIVINGQLYVRVSAFVYNHMQDYIVLRDAILDIHENFK